MSIDKKEEEKVVKKRECAKRYREANLDKVKTRQKEHYEANRDKILELRKTYYKANRDKVVAQQKAYYKANRDKMAQYMKEYQSAPEARRRAFRGNMRRLYGLTEREYDDMVIASCGRCASCGRMDDGSKALGIVIDHDHATGRVRGLICHQCNSALGLLEESLERLAELSSYIRREVASDEDWSI